MSTRYTVRGIARSYDVHVIGADYTPERVRGIIEHLEQQGHLPARTVIPGGPGRGLLQVGIGQITLDCSDGDAVTVAMIPPDGTLIVGPAGWPARL